MVESRGGFGGRSNSANCFLRGQIHGNYLGLVAQDHIITRFYLAAIWPYSLSEYVLGLKVVQAQVPLLMVSRKSQEYFEIRVELFVM
jgi:hypothetical protein